MALQIGFWWPMIFTVRVDALRACTSSGRRPMVRIVQREAGGLHRDGVFGVQLQRASCSTNWQKPYSISF